MQTGNFNFLQLEHNLPYLLFETRYLHIFISNVYFSISSRCKSAPESTIVTGEFHKCVNFSNFLRQISSIQFDSNGRRQRAHVTPGVGNIHTVSPQLLLTPASRRNKCAGQDVLTRQKMGKKAIKGVNQIKKKKIRWIDGNVFVIKFVLPYTCPILQRLQSLRIWFRHLRRCSVFRQATCFQYVSLSGRTQQRVRHVRMFSRFEYYCS